MRHTKKYLGLCALSLLAACQSAPPPPGVKIGKPYNVNGTTYYPEYDATYDETGLASWYGPGFHGNRTANGEKFDTHDLTAAHPTLPMPSLVRVTNLENGKTLVVRINDRGPFARGRIIDLSKESAKRLGVKGLSKVRVQYLVPESDQYIAAVAEGRRIDMFAYNEQVEAGKESTILAATAPSSQSFIVESTHNQASSSDTVVNAAPIVSVSNSDLPAQTPPRTSGGGLIVSQAWAGESVRKPAAPVRAQEVVLSSDSEQLAPVELVQPSQPVAKAVAKPSGKGYFVQVGSFSQQANAEKMKSHIAPIAESKVAMVEVGGHNWWRLRAGPFENDGAAQEALEKIRASGATDARILME